MANIVITSTTNSIKVEFNSLSTAAGIKKGVWRKSDVRFELVPDGSVIRVFVKDDPDWNVTYNTGMIIDSVDGASPSSNSDLYDKLKALIA